MQPVELDEPLRPLPAASGVDLWLVDLAAPATSAALATLSEHERSRAARFVFEQDRRRYQVAHGVLRSLLGERLGEAPGDIALLYGPHEKPAVAAHYGCAFNLSHSGDLALIGIARDLPGGAEIGIDIEELRAVSDASALARANFTRAEQDELARVAPAQRDRLFLSGWTRKEACLKAAGTGLSVAPATFECGLAPRRAQTRVATLAGVVEIEVDSIDIGPRGVAALAVTTRTRR